MGKFLVGSVLREVRNGRLNCNNAQNEEFKSGNDNTTYVKKIRVGRETYPYASAQWQKKNIKEFAKNQGHKISPVVSLTSTSVYIEGNPYSNYDEDIMGFMIAQNIELNEEQYSNLSEEERVGFKKSKGKYKKNITKKRRSNLMLSPLQAIGSVRVTDEFSTRTTDKTPLLYSKEVYAADMSCGFILDIDKVGVFNANDNESAYRDYSLQEVEELGKDVDDTGLFYLSTDEKLRRINTTIDGIHHMDTRVTMTNNLENLSAKFIILAEYKIGSAIFNNIFGDGKLKIQYLKEEIEKMELYRLSKIYIGCSSEYFKQEDRYLKDILEFEFANDDRIIMGDVNSAIESYKEYLKNNI